MKNLLLSATFLGLFLLHTTYVHAEEAWESSYSKERLEAFIDSTVDWSGRVDEWEFKRRQMQSNILNVNSSDDRYNSGKTHCNEKGCWTFSRGYFEFVSAKQSDKVSSVDIDNPRCEWFYDDGYVLNTTTDHDNIYHIYYTNDSTGFIFESLHRGSIIKYHNGKGESWESIHEGSIVKYDGPKTKWNSVHFGRNLEVTDKTTGITTTFLDRDFYTIMYDSEGNSYEKSTR